MDGKSIKDTQSIQHESDNITTEDSFRDAIHIFKTSQHNDRISANSQEIFKELNPTQNPTFAKYLYPTLIILPICIVIISIWVCNVSIGMKVFLSLLLLFTLIVYISHLKGYDIFEKIKSIAYNDIKQLNSFDIKHLNSFVKNGLPA